MLRYESPKRLIAVNVTAIRAMRRCEQNPMEVLALAAVLDSPKMSFAEAGRRGARARFGPLRTVHLNTLDPVTAGIIRAIIEARESAKAAPASENAGAGASTEGTRARRETAGSGEG